MNFAVLLLLSAAALASATLRGIDGRAKVPLKPNQVIVSRSYEPEAGEVEAAPEPAAEWRYISTNHEANAGQVSDPTCGNGKECRKVVPETKCLGFPCVMKADVVGKVHEEGGVEVVGREAMKVHRVVDEKERERPKKEEEECPCGMEATECGCKPKQPTEPVVVARSACEEEPCEEEVVVAHVSPCGKTKCEAHAPEPEAKPEEAKPKPVPKLEPEPCDDCEETRHVVEAQVHAAREKALSEIAEKQAEDVRQKACAGEAPCIDERPPCDDCADTREKTAALLAAAKQRVFGAAQ